MLEPKVNKSFMSGHGFRGTGEGGYRSDAPTRHGIGKGAVMKLYDSSRAPNPRRVRIFLAEKGVSVPTEQVDLVSLQQRSPAYTAITPVQRVPALVLDDGTVITESIAICRYFEWLHSEPRLFG